MRYLTIPCRLVEDLQYQVEQSSSIISRLFPGYDLEDLTSLSRAQLVDLSVTLPASTTSPSTNSEPAVGPTRPTLHSHRSDGADSLEALEQAPEQDPEMDEAKRHKDRVQGISDDVNGLSLSVDKISSYVGLSSISAVLKVIFRTVPVARPFIAQSYIDTAEPSRSNSPRPSAREFDLNYLPSADIGHKLIDSYFTHVHVLMPMIDEEQFWHTYLYGERKDSPWLALLNIVMALGSLAGSTCDNEDHIGYYKRARFHLDLETFGSGNLLMLQALGLVSGYYLHWLNRPNEANCVMGATLRMATALGLHREYNDGIDHGSSKGMTLSSGLEVPVEIRRRTWWSLFCLDAWGSTTTGRPSLGRLGPGITVRSPRIPERMNNAQYLASLRLLPVIHNIEFCKIATRIQDTLAAQPLCKFDDLFALDAELVKWHDDLPPILRDLIERPNLQHRHSSQGNGHRHSGTPSITAAGRKNSFDFSQPPERDNTVCPEVLKTPRAVMHWRYQNLRMLMHRPFLLAAALRRQPFSTMSAEEKVTVGRCRIIAAQTITDIDLTCEQNLIAGWNAVWMMYQAVMVPLVSLFSFLSSPSAYLADGSPRKSADNVDGAVYGSGGGDEDAEKWRQQIETALFFFDKMQRYSVAAKKSKDVVQRLYEASKHISQLHTQQHHQPPVNSLYHQNSGSKKKTNPADPAGTPFSTNPANQSHLQSQHLSGNPTFGQPIWGLSPNRNAVMETIWDDMMWETFPEIPEVAPGWTPGLDQFDWMPPGEEQGDPNENAQHWPQWPLDGPQA